MGAKANEPTETRVREHRAHKRLPTNRSRAFMRVEGNPRSVLANVLLNALVETFSANSNAAKFNRLAGNEPNNFL
jgi:hypothetical protein